MRSIYAVWVWKDPFKNMKNFFEKQGTPENWLREGGAVTSDDDAAIIFFDGDDQLGGFDNNPPEDGFRLFKDGRLAVWCRMAKSFMDGDFDPQVSISETDGMDMPDQMFIIPCDPKDEKGPDLSFMELI